MREIKFRGKAKNSDWKYGCLELDQVTNRYSILMGYEDLGYEVEEDSIGQYTGLKDKNGVEIYEGDIVKVTLPDNRKEIGCVEYDEDYCEYRVAINNYEYTCLWKKLQFEILGNIYENPELIEKEGK